MEKIRAGFVLTIFLILVAVTASKAQNNKTGVFGIGTIVLPGDSLHRWGGYLELQARSNKFFNQFYYFETKGGVSYDIANNYTALIGFGRYVTEENDDIGQSPIKEFRVWQQLTIGSYLDRVKFEHRYRAEQRWQNGIYRNRFRYRLNVVIPINNRKLVPDTYFLSVFDEVFLNNKVPHFERNRFSLALGYQFTKAMSLQAGWLNQYNFSATSAGAKNNLAITVQYRINRKNANPKDHLPTTFD
jgi:hypothetical protein